MFISDQSVIKKPAAQVADVLFSDSPLFITVTWEIPAEINGVILKHQLLLEQPGSKVVPA